MKNVLEDAQEILDDLNYLLENYDFLADFDMKSLVERIVSYINRAKKNYRAMQTIIEAQKKGDTDDCCYRRND